MTLEFLVFFYSFFSLHCSDSSWEAYNQSLRKNPTASGVDTQGKLNVIMAIMRNPSERWRPFLPHPYELYGDLSTGGGVELEPLLSNGSCINENDRNEFEELLKDNYQRQQLQANFRICTYVSSVKRGEGYIWIYYSRKDKPPPSNKFTIHSDILDVEKIIPCIDYRQLEGEHTILNQIQSGLLSSRDVLHFVNRITQAAIKCGRYKETSPPLNVSELLVYEESIIEYKEELRLELTNSAAILRSPLVHASDSIGTDELLFMEVKSEIGLTTEYLDETNALGDLLRDLFSSDNMRSRQHRAVKKLEKGEALTETEATYKSTTHQVQIEQVNNFVDLLVKVQSNGNLCTPLRGILGLSYGFSHGSHSCWDDLSYFDLIMGRDWVTKTFKKLAKFFVDVYLPRIADSTDACVVWADNLVFNDVWKSPHVAAGVIKSVATISVAYMPLRDVPAKVAGSPPYSVAFRKEYHHLQTNHRAMFDYICRHSKLACSDVQIEFKNSALSRHMNQSALQLSPEYVRESSCVINYKPIVEQILKEVSSHTNSSTVPKKIHKPESQKRAEKYLHPRWAPDIDRMGSLIVEEFMLAINKDESVQHLRPEDSTNEGYTQFMEYVDEFEDVLRKSWSTKRERTGEHSATPLLPQLRELCKELEGKMPDIPKVGLSSMNKGPMLERYKLLADELEKRK